MDFNWTSLMDWIHLRFNSVDSVLAGISKAITNLEKDIEVRSRNAVKAENQSMAVLAAAKRKADGLDVTAETHRSAVDKQKNRLTKIKTTFDL